MLSTTWHWRRVVNIFMTQKKREKKGQRCCPRQATNWKWGDSLLLVLLSTLWKSCDFLECETLVMSPTTWHQRRVASKCREVLTVCGPIVREGEGGGVQRSRGRVGRLPATLHWALTGTGQWLELYPATHTHMDMLSGQPHSALNDSRSWSKHQRRGTLPNESTYSCHWATYRSKHADFFPPELWKLQGSQFLSESPKFWRPTLRNDRTFPQPNTKLSCISRGEYSYSFSCLFCHVQNVQDARETAKLDTQGCHTDF